MRGLSLESRYQRMLSAGTKVTPEWIASMTHIDYRRHMAFAITTLSDGIEQFVTDETRLLQSGSNSRQVIAANENVNIARITSVSKQ